MMIILAIKRLSQASGFSEYELGSTNSFLLYKNCVSCGPSFTAYSSHSSTHSPFLDMVTAKCFKFLLLMLKRRSVSEDKKKVCHFKVAVKKQIIKTQQLNSIKNNFLNCFFFRSSPLMRRFIKMSIHLTKSQQSFHSGFKLPV